MKWRARLGIAAAGVLAIVCCGCSSAAHPPSFNPMPADPHDLTAVLGPMTGTGSRTLTVTASRSMSLMMGCIGKGTLTVSGPLSAGAVLCSDASYSRGAFGGFYWGRLSVRPGERIKLRVAADAKTIWDIRVDGLPRQCEDDVCSNVVQTAPPS